MTLIVEMARGLPGDTDFETHTCSYSQWMSILSIARANGWTPAGCVPDPIAVKNYHDYGEHFSEDYEPSDWAYCKRLSDEDAYQLAQALQRAYVTYEHADDTFVLIDCAGTKELEVIRSNQPIAESVRGLTKFMGCGGFAFAMDD